MNTNKEKKGYFWKVAVVVLLVVIGVQAVITYNIMNREAESKSVSIEPETLQLTPRTISIADPSITAPGQVVPRTISKLNLNLNDLSGVKKLQNPQPQQMVLPFQQLSPSNGMSMNISSKTLGADMDKLIEVMKSMMNNSGGGFGGMNMPTGNSSTMGNTTASDISVDKNNNYVLELTIPGLDKTTINTEVNGLLLTITGVQREEVESSGPGGSSFMSSSRTFHKSFTLPGPVKKADISLEYKDDTMTIKVPKA